MKVFLDTNILIAAFVSHGQCADLLEYCMNKHRVFISYFVLNEFTEKLRKKFKYPQEEIDQAQLIILSGAIITAEAQHLKVACRDEDDLPIIAAAVAADVDCIISGDNDLRVLKKVHGIPVVSPRDFWKFEEDFKARI